MDLAMAIVDIHRVRKIKEVGGKGLSGEAWWDKKNSYVVGL